MDNHSPMHAQRVMYAGCPSHVLCISINWRNYGFGIERCNEHAETITGDGLRWSTRTATLVAALDGTDFGVYLFRTKGGRYFPVRRHYPMTYDKSDPLDILTIDQATRLYATIVERGYGKVDPFEVAFPSLALTEA